MNVSQWDEERIHKLHTWLLSRNIDVIRSGHDLTMPSPFKEKTKRITEGAGYVDQARRLWVTVAIFDGKPKLLWSCWFTKRRDSGKNMGGVSAYALSVRTGVPEYEIMALLDLQHDEAVKMAEGLIEKCEAILSQPLREKAARDKAREAAPTTIAARVAHDMPTRLIPLFTGNDAVFRPEQMLTERAISPETSLRYAVCWDADQQAIMFPWALPDGTYAYCQWWDGKKYRFPPKDAQHLNKEDLIFGIDQWKPTMPLTLTEGAFDAMTLWGCGLGGSSMTEQQRLLIGTLKPDMVINAFDNDPAGIAGAAAVTRALRGVVPEAKIVQVFPPHPHKDWNDLAKVVGQQNAVAEYCRRVQAAQDDHESGSIVNRVKQMLR